MNLKNEKKLLFLIRYLISILIILLAIFITTFLYIENKNTFEEIKKITEEKFINDKKEYIKEQINNLYDYILLEQKDTEEKLRKSLKSRVYEAHLIISKLNDKYKDTHTKEQITDMVRTVIKDIRFNNNRGYYFIYDKNGKSVIHSLLPNLEGKYILNERLKLLENDAEAYQEWYWRKSQNDINEYKKIGFIKNIYEMDWIVGTGEYIESFIQDIQKEVLSQINKLKFGTNSYFIVTDKNNNYLSHINKDLIGKNAFEKIRNVSDKNNLEQISNTIEQGSGFVSLEFYKPNSTIKSYKIIYLKKIPKWDWIISTGFYMDDINTVIDKEKETLTLKFEENIKKLVIISFFLTLILLSISFYLSFLIEREFKKYKNSIELYISENKKQYEVLSQKSKLIAMGEMIENIAHQWRQPLSLITTQASGVKIQKEMDTLIDENLIKSMDSITNTANYLSDTIDDFKDFFRLDKEKKVFKLKNLVEKAFSLLSSEIKNKNIVVIENLSDISVNSYKREIVQVLLNILRNAIDAVCLVEGKKYIFIDILREEDRTVLKIKDNAGGIPDEIMERIFEPYFTTKHKSQGTGIGLYMSKEIISRHILGELSVENITYEFQGETFTGANFVISFPIDK